MLLTVILSIAFTACTTTRYYPIKQRFEIITLADIPVAEEIKQTSRTTELASAHSFFSPKLNETDIAFKALNGKAKPSSYIEGYFSSLHILPLYFQKSFVGREVELVPLKSAVRRADQ
ncbi:MAG: hypothetical protein OEX19_14260 [Gammaproteobacteria bacterium]|nr:hypothetical protein [Gammaproteobacteria bacterium]